MDIQGVDITINSSHAKKFNYNLLKMMDQIQQMFPGEIKRLSFFRFKLKLLFAVNTKLASELYLVMMEDKIEPIMKRDSDFFNNINLMGEYDRVNEKIGVDRDSFENFMALFRRFFELYHETQDPQLLEMIGQYLEIMMCYSLLSSRREDLIEEMNKFRTNPLILPAPKNGFFSRMMRQ